MSCLIPAEINGEDEAYAKRLLGTLDTSYLFAYAFGMFFTGMIAERVDLRYFLSVGMVMSGVITMAFGFGKWMGIHHIAYYIAVQGRTDVVRCALRLVKHKECSTCTLHCFTLFNDYNNAYMVISFL